MTTLPKSDLCDAASEEVVALVEGLANQVHDPCALAQGVSVGLKEMGLIREIRTKQKEDGVWDVVIRIRLTSPGCLYFSYFEEQLARLASAYADISVSVEWDSCFDWTRSDMSERVLKQLDQRQALMIKDQIGEKI